MARYKDINIAKAIVDAILTNLETKKRHIHVFEIEVEEEESVYDLTIDRNNFIDALEKNLTHYEKEELYEECAKIVDAIKFLKNKVNG
jgi:protein-arginine kinase activator protein McsA